MKKNLFTMIDCLIVNSQNKAGHVNIGSAHWIQKGLMMLIVAVVVANGATAQSTTDSLKLNDVISKVIESHPTLKQAQQALVIADAKVVLAQSGYMPRVEADGTYSHIGPVPSISMPGLGSFDMAAADNYNAAINYSQTVYDFGKTSKEVALAREAKNMSQLTIEQLKQKLAMNVVTGFYTLLYLQDAIDIKNEQLATLKKHLENIQKKKETGSATQYEVLATQVRISTVESQLTDLETGCRVQASVLNVLMGQSERTPLVVKKELAVSPSPVESDSLVSFAFNNRDEMKLVREKRNLAQMNFNSTHAQNNPSVNVFASGGYKNGYFPDLTQPKLNYAVGLGIKVPLYDGNHKKENLVIAKSNIESIQYETDMVGRDITVEVVKAQNELDAQAKKMKQYELQLSQAHQALLLAQTSFKNGVITNLDLLDAANAVSESELWLLRSRIDYLNGLYKLKSAIGERLY